MIQRRVVVRERDDRRLLGSTDFQGAVLRPFRKSRNARFPETSANPATSPERLLTRNRSPATGGGPGGGSVGGEAHAERSRSANTIVSSIFGANRSVLFSWWYMADPWPLLCDGP